MLNPKFSYFHFLFASFLYFSFFAAYFPTISPNNFFLENNLFFIILFFIPNLLVSLYGISVFFLPTAMLSTIVILKNQTWSLFFIGFFNRQK